MGRGGSFLLATLFGAAGGWLLWMLDQPLPWLIGAMIATALASVLGVPIATPSVARPPMTALIGTMLGTSFTADTFARAGEWVLPLATLVLFLLVAGAAGYVLNRRLGGLDRPTAFFAGMPGGLIEMVALGREHGGDERLIALSHGARIFLVVLLLPFLLEFALGEALPRSAAVPVPFGAIGPDEALWFGGTYALGLLFGRVVRLPARYMLAPLIVSAGVHLSGLSDFMLPSGLVAAAQVIIGAVIGCRFAGIGAATVGRSMALSLATTSVLLGIAFAFAAAAASLVGQPFGSLVLAFAPGGLAEMSLIALALDGEVAFVLVHHLARVVLVVAAAPVVFRLFGGRPPSGT